MTVPILHLSDIHIHLPSDHVLSRASAIAQTLNPYLPDATAVVIVLSGDVAQSGQKGEYELASKLVDEVVAAVKAEKAIDVTVIIAPGNHDCDFSGDQEARLAIVSAAKNRSSDMPDSYIAAATAVQVNFFEFRRRHECGSNVRVDQPLWATYEVATEGKTIYFDVLNASWMSTMAEQQGGLVFPFEPYKSFASKDADLRLAVLHHPLNWYSQANYLAFRTFLQRLEDVILTGHEHQSNGRTSDDTRSGECAFVEGAALQPRGSSESGLNVVCIDLVRRKFSFEAYELRGAGYQSTSPPEWKEYRDLPKRLAAELSIADDFRVKLCDPGAALRHPSGKELQLADIYVYPDLDVRTSKKVADRTSSNGQKPSSKSLLAWSSMENHVLVEGDESAGKTKLLHKLFLDYHGEGSLPLLVDARKIKSTTPRELDSHLAICVSTQYGDSARERYVHTPIARKVLLLDDLDQCPLNAASRGALLDRLSDRFGRLVVTVGEDYELSELFGEDDSARLSSFKQYRLSPLGYQRRSELIRKWNSFGADETTSTNGLLEAHDEIERLVESSKMQHVASTVPIFVLSILQAAASGLTKELQNSAFANYYSYLILGALERSDVRNTESAKYIAACTHLSWFIKVHGDDQKISVSQYRKFVQDYSLNWTETTEEQLLAVLRSARLVEVDGDTLAFAYPYAFYYFLGRYASISLKSNDVQDYLRYCMKHLYVRECANTLLFLAHHTGTTDVLDHIIQALREQFADKLPVTLAKNDVAVVSRLIANAPALKYKAQKPEEYRRKQAEYRDESDNGDDGLIDAPRAEPSDIGLFEQIVSLTKSIEIAGALLSHQFPNYPRVKKEAAIKEIFDAALRATRELYSYFEADPEELVKSIVVRIRKRNQDLSAEGAEQQTRLAIGMLLRAVATSFVMRAGMYVRSSDLKGNVDGVLGEQPSCAYRLIRLSQLLSRPARIPRVEIGKLVKEEAENACVMGVLHLLVFHRLYMYETDFDDKDWVMGTFGQGGKVPPAIEQRHRKFAGNSNH
jgi:Calcineurin-like phosphoesterase